MFRVMSLICIPPLLSVLPAKAQEDDVRWITGTLGYVQRIALPPKARATVVAEGRFGAMLGETTLNPDGKQVPLPFEMAVPPGLAGEVSAVIRVHGEPRWVLRGLAFETGREPVDLGELTLEPVTPIAFATELVCGDVSVMVGILGEEMVLRAEGRDIPLVQVEAASGARYEGVKDRETTVWNKGDATTIRLEGRDLPECREVLPAGEMPYRARGNEPGWYVDLGPKTAEIVGDYGEITREAPRPVVQVVPGAYDFDMPDAGAHLRIEERLCHDDMSGMPYPDTAILTLDGRDLRGCGGDPSDLLIDGVWQVTALGDAELIEPERLSLNFLNPGRVAGSSGCNRLIGGFTLTGEGLQFGAMGSTMMACHEPLMEQERRMLDALEQVTRFDVTADGALLLIGGEGGGVLLEARQP
ncbi:META domain protein [Roseovarius sp. A-2]|uniref:META domain-containing protein n=1 Tax=Roseovarius sp. A-2 TaxID=1570360 RepID=UPI0009B5178B|nr:META domain-containing protein [Roseovarius sp. A-2]GAW34663.1 META domain protein [Roseovarius sp. A-2]